MVEGAESGKQKRLPEGKRNTQKQERNFVVRLKITLGLSDLV